MRFFIISDDADAVTGMRLAGIEGKVVHNDAEAHAALDRAVAEEDIGVLLLTAGVCERYAERTAAMKQSGSRPLVVTIPDRRGNGSSGEAIARYVREAVGIRI